MNWNTIVELRRHMLLTEPVDCVAISVSDCGQLNIVNDSVPDALDILIVFAASDDAIGPQLTRYISAALAAIKSPPKVLWARAAFCVEKLSGRGERVSCNKNDDTVKYRIEDYLAYALLPYFSRKFGRCYTISHFAQTLDGRIASTTGDSRWIGNQDNLIHAHRMRALCDGILIGSTTCRLDKPSLNVRHVEGDDPVRIIMGDSVVNAASFSASDAAHIHVTSELIDSATNTKEESYGASVQNGLRCHSVLDFLYRQQLHSIYIEGGAQTTSSFFSQGAIDQLQIHFAPVIIGSGKTGFQFSGIEEIQEALTFEHSRYVSVGGQMMFIGEPTVTSTAQL